ncbi:MAG: hypothetical protein GF364_02440 [Candidatus Lokiarchaeota archaeon]|nr:hypothetical protein [Candidatus Lokiarchaeota archaeon]
MSGEQAIQSEWLISKQKNGINIKAGLIQRTIDIATLENDNTRKSMIEFVSKFG